MSIVGFTEQRSKRLDSAFECIRDDVLAHMSTTMSMEIAEWFRCNFDHNVPDGKVSNVMSVVDSMEILHGRTLSDDEFFKAALLEWCIKLLEASRLNVYSDGKLDRHHPNQQCWYVGEDIVIKDSFWLDVVLYHLLKKHFRMEPYYVHLLELFHDTTFQAELGILANFTAASEAHVDPSKFSLQRCALAARSRVTELYLPVALAMCVCGVPETYTLHGCLFSPYTTARSVLLQLGVYVQIQADFLDYVGKVEDISKAMSNIVENKCSRCVNVTLIGSSPKQRKVLQDSCGRKDSEKENRIQEIYEMNGIREQYLVCEAGLKERIEALIVEIPEPEGDVDGFRCVLKREVFSSLFNRIYTRTM